MAVVLCLKALRGLKQGSKSGAGRVFCLVGFMGAGKTTVGEKLAQHLGCSFSDLDQLIEDLERQTVAEIFSRQGQKVFRNIETEALRRYLAERGNDDCVLALGGGAMIQADNQTLLKEAGATMIFLEASPETLWKRCVDAPGSSLRPLLKDKASFFKLYAEREPVYRHAAHTFSTDGKSADDVAKEIATALGVAG